VTNRFALLELDAADGQRSVGALDGAESSAAGTGPLRAEQLGLLLQQDAEGSFVQAGSSGSGDLLHGIQIDVRARPCLAKGVPGNNLAPARSEFTDFLEMLRREFALRHGQSCLVLTRIG
jgi:hypothetical protein